MKVLTIAQTSEVSAGLNDSQLTYLITSALQTITSIGLKAITNDLSLGKFLLTNVAFPVINVVTLAIGYELANYCIEYRKAKQEANNQATA